MRFVVELWSIGVVQVLTLLHAVPTLADDGPYVHALSHKNRTRKGTRCT